MFLSRRVVSHALRDESISIASLPLLTSFPQSPEAVDVRRLPDDGPSLLEPIEMYSGNVHDEVLLAGSVQHFESRYFVGKAIMRMREIKGEDDAYFRGRVCTMQTVVQGRFKTEVEFRRAYTGQTFKRPIRNLPLKWLINAVLSVVRLLSPALRENITGDSPYLISPLAATAQTLIVSKVGEEPNICDYNLQENTRLLGGTYFDSGPGVRFTQRKAFLSKTSNLAGHKFSPDLVYTFDFYQDMLRPLDFTITVGPWKFNLADYLDHQPILAMALLFDPEKTRELDHESIEWLWNFEIWHESLVKSDI